MEKYGFVYIWYDKKHKRFYIGCHWGHELDGYICSSTWMKNSYKRRPHDFKRRILKRNIHNKKEMFDEEYFFLNMIKNEELGKRYYNLRNHRFINGSDNTGKMWSDETKLKMSIAHTGKPKKPHSAITKAKMSAAKKGKTYKPLSDETKLKMSIAHTGKPKSEEHKAKMSSKPKSEEHKAKISLALKGKAKSEGTKIKMSKARNKIKGNKNGI